MKKSKGITLVALVITIVILLILAGITIRALIGENGLITRAKQAKEETEISNYKEKIELIKMDLQMQNKDFTPPTIAQLKEEFDANHKKWVSSTEIITDNGKEKLKLITKEGYIFYITESTTEYKGKGKVVDTSALQRDDVIKLKKTQETEKGKLVQITDLSGRNYYKIKYQINSEEGEWQDIKSGNEVEVPYGGTIYAKLIYGSDSGIVHRLSVENSEPKVVEKEIDLSNLTRKTEISIADLFEITWGSDGTGTTEYTVTGNLNFNNTSFSSTKINNISNLEIGTYKVTCKAISPSKQTATAEKEVKVTALANTSVTNESNTNLEAKAIYSEYDLAYFSELVNNGQNTINAKVMNDIDLANVCPTSVRSWNSIGNSTNKYAGIFDGNEKTINNIYINSNEAGKGLFGYIENARISNITLGEGSISAKYDVGGICGNSNESIISNCKNNNVSVKGKGYIEKTYIWYADETYKYCNVGGIIGYSYNSNIESCMNQASFSGTYSAVGGIVGFDDGNKERMINNCNNTASVSITLTDGTYGVGGIVGESYYLGVISNCNNTGNISCNINYIGGINGALSGGKIIDCKNTGNITGNAAIGGISGQIINVNSNSSLIPEINGSINEGTIKSTGSVEVRWILIGTMGKLGF